MRPGRHWRSPPKKRGPIGLALLAALVGCVEERPSGPVPLVISPSQAAAESSAAVEISGERFEALVHTDFRDGKRSLIDPRFAARLAPTESSAAPVELEEVRLVRAGVLAAKVPSKIERGLYDVVVVDPAGRPGTLPGAYRAVSSAESVAAFRIEPIESQRYRVPFQLSLTAIDELGRTVDGFTGTVAVSDRTGTLEPKAAGPFALGRARVLVAVAALEPANAVTAADPLGHSSSSNEFAVRRGLPVAVAFATPPQALAAGQCSARVELELRDVFDAPAEPAGAVAVDLGASPGGAASTFSDPSCAAPAASVTLPADGSRAAFHFRASASGTVALRAAPKDFPAATQEQTVAPGPPAALALATPAQAVPAGKCSGPVRVEVRDAYGNLASPAQPLSVTLSAEPAGAASFYLDSACASPTSEVAIAQGAGAAAFHFQGGTPGAITVRASASGLISASQVESITQ